MNRGRLQRETDAKIEALQDQRVSQHSMDSERPTNPPPDEDEEWVVITTVAHVVVRAKTPQEAREKVEARGFTVIEVKHHDDDSTVP